LSLCANPGLELANAFGVFLQTEPVLFLLQRFSISWFASSSLVVHWLIRIVPTLPWSMKRSVRGSFNTLSPGIEKRPSARGQGIMF